MEQLIIQINSELIENIDENYKKNSARFFKEQILCYGVRMPIVRKIGSKYISQVCGIKKQQILLICESLLKSDYNENAAIAIQWTSKILEIFGEDDFATFESWMKKYINNWAKDDDFCLNLLSHFIVKFPQCKNQVKSWALSNNKWMRRASAVSFIMGGGRWKVNHAYIGDVFEVAVLLMKDREDLVQKGMGWMLKVAAESHRKEVFDFIIKHKKDMSRTALRYSIEKMPKEMRIKGMRK